MKSLISLLCLSFIQVDFIHAVPDERIKELFQVAVSNVAGDTIDEPVTVNSGEVPQWLQGNFLRHGCGAFGETKHIRDDHLNYVDHLFDCIEMGTNFRIENGEIRYTNRFYDTDTVDIWDHYSQNMNESSVYFYMILGTYNVSQRDTWRNYYATSGKDSSVPHVSWWQVGNDVLAMTEDIRGNQIDMSTISNMGGYDYADNNLGYPGNVYVINNPAHEGYEEDGTLWSSTCAFIVEGPIVKSWRAVYKMGSDKRRTVIGEYHYEDIDLSLCQGPGQDHPNLNARLGYIHSFATTENYIVIPETGYMFEPCMFFVFPTSDPVGFFMKNFKWPSNNPMSRLLVMRKSDGEFVGSVTVPGFFVTHQLNAYEDNGLLHMDMLVYNDSRVYTYHTFTKTMMDGDKYISYVERFTLQMSDWTLVDRRNLQKHTGDSLEMPNINHKRYATKKYKYAYMAKNIFLPYTNYIVKLDVDTGDEMEYEFADGLFVQEPIFEPAPNAQSEDDGVIIAQGTDSNVGKAFMVVIDAQTMTLICHVTAPDLALIGLHNKLFDLGVGEIASTWASGAVVTKWYPSLVVGLALTSMISRVLFFKI